MSNIDFNKLFSELPSESEAETTPEEQTQVETTQEETPQVVETAEEPTEKETEAKPEHARDDKGRFTPKEERQAIPLDALLEERTKRQEAERQRQAIEQELAELKAKRDEASIPDPFDDAPAYTEYMKQQIAAEVNAKVADLQRQQQEKWFNASAAKAIDANGKEAVDAAINFASQKATLDPQFAEAMMAQADPVSWIIEQQNRHALADEILRDPEGYIAKRLAEQGNVVAAQAGTTNSNTMAAKSKAPKSIASIGSGNTSVKTNDRTSAEEFEAIFNRNR